MPESARKLEDAVRQTAAALQRELNDRADAIEAEAARLDDTKGWTRWAGELPSALNGAANGLREFAARLRQEAAAVEGRMLPATRREPIREQVNDEHAAVVSIERARAGA